MRVSNVGPGQTLPRRSRQRSIFSAPMIPRLLICDFCAPRQNDFREMRLTSAPRRGKAPVRPEPPNAHRHSPRERRSAMANGSTLYIGLDVQGQRARQVLRALGAYDVVQPGQGDVEHVAVEEQERAERLVLGRGGDAALDRQRAQEAGDLGRSHLGRVALAVEEDVAADPRDVGLLGAPAVVTGTHGVAHAVEQPRFGRAGCAGLPHGCDRPKGGDSRDPLSFRAGRTEPTRMTPASRTWLYRTLDADDAPWPWCSGGAVSARGPPGRPRQNAGRGGARGGACPAAPGSR